MQNLNITDFVKLRLDNIGIDHFSLILSKKITNFDLDIKLYEYGGITWGDYTHYEYLMTSTKIGISDYLSGVHKVVMAPFNYDGPETYQFKASGFKDENILMARLNLQNKLDLTRSSYLKAIFTFMIK